MAKGINKVLLLGNVGKDPEIRATAGGMTVATFSLATADRKKGTDGQWADSTEWHNLVAFQRTAEIVRDYVKKGTQLFIEGKIQTRSWDDKETGAKKYRTEVVVDELVLLGAADGAREQSSSAGGASRTASAVASRPASAPVNRPVADNGGDPFITDSDIPF